MTVDTDVLVIEYLASSVERYSANHRFLTSPGQALGTTVYNLLEFLGHASLRLSRSRIREWQEWLCAAYDMEIVWPQAASLPGTEPVLTRVLFDWPFSHISQGHFHYRDAAVYDLVERVPNMSALVTWNTRHFQDKGRVPAYTPAEFLTR